MSFLDWIEKTRLKPEAARRRIAVVWTFLITGALAVVWLSVFFSGGKIEQNKNYSSPFSIIKDLITGNK
ncbi:hypothetical protein KKB69_00620 [Patescibacteria group bacterium]|nr:hypothetical protein [Patescibacteria group bacterium]